MTGDISGKGPTCSPTSLRKHLDGSRLKHIQILQRDGHDEALTLRTTLAYKQARETFSQVGRGKMHMSQEYLMLQDVLKMGREGETLLLGN